jgi:beta-galactosidase
MRLKMIAAVMGFLALSATLPLSAQIRGPHQERLTFWEFSKDGRSWQRVSVPHSYNALDGHSPEYYRGKATYRCDFRPGDIKNPHFVLFEGAAQAATVKVNGVQLASHKGGYTPFVVDISEALKRGSNTLEVVCDNSEDLNLAPVSSDFNKNGGLHNPVWLMEMEDVYLSPEAYGMYRMHCLTPEVSKRKVETRIKTRLVNSSAKGADVMVRVQLVEKDGTLGYQADREIHLAPKSEMDFEHDFEATGIRFWNGLKDPYLYTARVEVFKGKRMLDIAEVKVGYRSYEIDPVRGFLLNGEPYPLRGVAMHQDADGKASALREEDIRRDFGIIKELGANFLRLAHYPHNDLTFSLCDSLGIVTQTEVPWVNVCGTNAKQAYFNNIRYQMEEMITNLYNHPSIIFWGMWNELDRWGNNDDLQGPFDGAKVLTETGRLYDHAKKLDPYRPVGFTDDSRLGLDGYVGLAGDFCSQNIYLGWYQTPNDFSGFAETIKDVRDRRDGPVNVSEYGAGINPFCHTWDTSKPLRDMEDDSKHFEEYGNMFHEAYVRQILRMPWLCFTSAWVLFDFPVASRMEGYMDSSDGEHFVRNDSRKYMNDKGLVTRDRGTKKDVFYLYKSLWNKKETTVYITSRRLKSIPAGKSFTIKVYSNAKNLTLYQNGKLVTKKNSSGEDTGVIWTFEGIRLNKDSDTFRVVANNGVKDEVTFSRK